MTDEREPMGPIARALVESAREVDDPSERDRVRVRARLAATLGVTALSAATAKVAAASAMAEAASTAGTGLGAAASGAGSIASAGASAGSGAAVAGALGVGAKAGIAATTAAATGAGSAVASGGLWAALGAKSLASVVAAAALGAAVTTAVVVVQREDSAAMADRAARETQTSAQQPNLRSQPAMATHSQRAATPSEHLATQRVAPNESAARTSNDAKSAPGAHSFAASQTVRAKAEPNGSARGSSATVGQRLPNATAASVPSMPASLGRETAASEGSSRVGRLTLGRAESAASAAAPATANLAIAGAAQPADPPNVTGTTAQPTGGTAVAASAAAPTVTNEAMLDDSLNAAAASAHTPNAARLDGAAQRPAKPAALSGEIQLLASAQRALRDNQLPRALTLLNEHAMRYPSGALRPEQLAARAVVLCRMGEKNAGRIELQKLQAETPNSPLIRWARDTCGL